MNIVMGTLNKQVKCAMIDFIYKVLFFTVGQKVLQKKIKPVKVDNMKVKDIRIRKHKEHLCYFDSSVYLTA